MLGVSPQTLVDYVKGVDRRDNKYKVENQRETVQKINTNDFELIRKAYALIEDFYEQKLGDNRNNAGASRISRLREVTVICGSTVLQEMN